MMMSRTYDKGRVNINVGMMVCRRVSQCPPRLVMHSLSNGKR